MSPAAAPALRSLLQWTAGQKGARRKGPLRVRRCTLRFVMRTLSIGLVVRVYMFMLQKFQSPLFSRFYLPAFPQLWICARRVFIYADHTPCASLFLVLFALLRLPEGPGLAKKCFLAGLRILFKCKRTYFLHILIHFLILNLLVPGCAVGGREPSAPEAVGYLDGRLQAPRPRRSRGVGDGGPGAPSAAAVRGPPRPPPCDLPGAPAQPGDDGGRAEPRSL